MDFRKAYREAAVVYVDLVSRIPAERWDRPALGEWSLRDLVGHTVGSGLRQVPAVLASPVATVVVNSPEGYFAVAAGMPPEVIEAAHLAATVDARETGKGLGDKAAVIAGEQAGLATAALAAIGDEDIVESSAGGMRVRDWIPTRTFELVVHGLDTARAADVAHKFSDEAVAAAAYLAARTSIAVGDGEVLVRALTGRTPLPAGYSML